MKRNPRSQRRKLSVRNAPKALRMPSNPTPALSASFAQKRILIAIAAGISAARISSEISRSKPVSSAPRKMKGWVGEIEWQERWDACINHLERLRTLAEMDEQLGIQAQDRSQVRGTIEWKVRIAKDTRASAVVAVEEGTSASRVRQLRMDYVAGRLFVKRGGR